MSFFYVSFEQSGSSALLPTCFATVLHHRDLVVCSAFPTSLVRWWRLVAHCTDLHRLGPFQWLGPLSSALSSRAFELLVYGVKSGLVNWSDCLLQCTADCCIGYARSHSLGCTPLK